MGGVGGRRGTLKVRGVTVGCEFATPPLGDRPALAAAGYLDCRMTSHPPSCSERRADTGPRIPARAALSLAGALGVALALASPGAQAQLAPPDLSAVPLFSPDIAVNQWYVTGTTASAFAGVDLLSDGRTVWGTGTSGINVSASGSLADLLGKSASAESRASATSLGAIASSHNLEPGDTLSGATAWANVSYMTVLDTPGTVSLDFRLSGRLSIDGGRSAAMTDPTRSAVAVYVMGAAPDMTTESVNAMFTSVGIDPMATDTALITQAAHWPVSSQPNLATYGQALDSLSVSNVAEVDTHLTVQSQGAYIDCHGLSPAPAVCGKYLYQFWGVMMTGAENGAVADFSHTLEATALHLPGGATLGFSDGQAIAVISSVPEPASAALMLAGLGLVGGWRRRRH